MADHDHDRNDDSEVSDLAQAVQDVSQRMTLLVHEEIALAKAEMTEKVSRLVKGIVVGVVAGIFAVAGLIYLLHALSWLVWKLIGGNDDFYLGFLIVAVALFVLGGLGGFLAYRFIKRALPPAPEMAIEEGRLIKETVTAPHPAEPQGRPTSADVPSTRSREEVEA
jgi:uncharacterized membrane protein YqjE